MIDNTLYVLGLVKRYDRRRLAYMISLAIITTLKTLINVIFIKAVLDCIREYQSIWVLLLVVGGERVISTTLSCIECILQWEKCPISDNIIKQGIASELYTESVKIGLAKLEAPEFYDKYQRALNEADNRAILLINTIGQFLSAVLTCFTLLTYLTYLDMRFVLLAMISSGISVPLSARISKINYKKDKDLTRCTREMAYVRRLFYLPDYADEIRMNDYNHLFFHKLEEGEREYRTKTSHYGVKSAFAETIRSWQLFVVNFGLAAFVLAGDILSGLIHVDAFTSTIFATASFSEAVTMMISLVPQMKEHSLFIDNLREMMTFEEYEYEQNDVLRKADSHSVRMEHIAFGYGNGGDNVLRDITLQIKPGEKIALVGKNGAGKSTLVRLILKLYEQHSGEIYFDNQNYHDISNNHLRENIAVVFQNQSIFAFSIAENLLGREMMSQDEEILRMAIDKSGLTSVISGLKNGINTVIGSEFDENGVVLSGGETQRLFLAKAYLKNAGLVIMDEPFSNQDPLWEADFYQKLMNLCENRTVIYISHQLYSTRMADRIFYLEDGTIQECGSHDQLMKLNGKYAALYRIQASQYQRAENA